MSEYGHVNNDPATIMRLFTSRNDERQALSTKTRPYRKATRSRASTVVVRRDSTIVHPPITDQHVLNLRQDGMGCAPQVGGDEVTGGSTRPAKARIVVVRPGGATRLGDYHRVGIQRTR